MLKSFVKALGGLSILLGLPLLAQNKELKPAPFSTNTTTVAMVVTNTELMRRPLPSDPVTMSNGVQVASIRANESKQEIVIKSDHAEATFGQLQVKFMGNGNDPDAIQLGGRSTVKGHVAFISYYEPETGRSVRIADAVPTTGEVEAPSTVYYRQAFNNINADIRYRYLGNTFEQDILIHSIVEPSEFKMSTNVIIKIWSEFLPDASPRITKRPVDLHEGSKLQSSALSRAEDSTLDFGSFKIVPGKGFVGNEDAPTATLKVFKEWVEIDGRKFLVESMSYPVLAGYLKNLPANNKTVVKREAQQNLELPPKTVSNSKEFKKGLTLAGSMSTPAS